MSGDAMSADTTSEAAPTPRRPSVASAAIVGASLVLALLTPLASQAQAPTPNDPSPAPQAPNDPSPTPTPAPEAPNEPSPIAPDPSLPPNDPTPTDPNDPIANPTADPTAPPSEPPDAPPPSTLPAGHEPVIHVELTPDSGLMTGDVLTLTLRVTTPARDEVTIPRGQSFAPFEVLHRPTPRVEVQGDRATHVIELELLALEPGDHELPSITLRVVTADGVVGEVQTAPLRVPVGSVLGNEPNAEPKPPSEPVEVWEDDYTLAWVLGGLGLILLGALFAWLFARWWRRRAKAAAPPPPPRPPWEIALEKLEALRLDRDAAVREERVVAWVDLVSDALREYLGRRYEFDGLESTTDEVVAELKKRKLIGLSIDEVIALLRDCDLVKFAKAPLGVEQSDLLLAGAFRVVRTTAPIAGVSAMGPVMVPGPSGPPSGPSAPGTPGTSGPTPPPPSGDMRWMGPPAAGASAGWTPPPLSTEPASPTPSSVATPPASAPSTTSTPQSAGLAGFDPSAPWTPPGATPSAPAPKVRAEDEWMPPGARLAPTFEPRLDAASPSPTPGPTPSASGDAIAPAPVRSAVLPTTREVPAAEAIAPAPVRSAVVPQTRVPEPPEPTPEVGSAAGTGAAGVPADFPATRPPAAMPTAPIPTTLPPTSPTVPMAPDADRTLVDESPPSTDAATEVGAASRTDDPRLRTLPGFGDPDRVGPRPALDAAEGDAKDPEDPS
jgi:hypothetical protein